MGLCQGVQQKKKHITDLLEKCYSGVFGVADYRSSFRIKKLKMTDPIWWASFIKINQIYLTAILNFHFCSAREVSSETPGAILFVQKKSKFAGLCYPSKYGLRHRATDKNSRGIKSHALDGQMISSKYETTFSINI